MRTSALATVALVALLAGCSNTNKSVNTAAPTSLAKIRSGADATTRDKNLRKGIAALQKGDYDHATIAFHTALNANPRDGLLHFMSGLTAHMEANSGKTDSYQRAEVAYKAALTHEPANRFASLQLARLYMENKSYSQAQDRFAEALLIAPNDLDLLQGLASASYMARNLKVAYPTIQRVVKERPTDVEALRTAALIHAALGKKEAAQTYLTSFKTVSDDKTANYVEKRIQDWSRIHTGKRFKQLAQADAMPTQNIAQPAAPDRNMAFVDLIIMRTEETGIQEEGKNIMKQLFAQVDTSWSRNEHKLRDRNSGSANALSAPIGVTSGTPGGANLTATVAGAAIPDLILNTQGHTLVKSFGLQAFNYALQIANTVNKSTEVIARPTLVALDGKMSTFFSGDQLVVGLTGALSGGALDRERVGVHLEFIPKFMKNGQIEFQVSVGRSFPEANLGEGLSTLGNFNGSSPFGATFQMAMGELSANVVMNFGQTLILAGLSEREVQKRKEGFPILKDIPVIQYFFAENKEIDYHKHLVIMMTPRKPGFRAGNEKPMDASDFPRRHLDRFLLAYAGNVPMEPNLKHVFAGLEANTFYKEFRSGDVSGNRWFHTKDRQYLIDQTLDMFYF